MSHCQASTALPLLPRPWIRKSEQVSKMYRISLRTLSSHQYHKPQLFVHTAKQSGSWIVLGIGDKLTNICQQALLAQFNTFVHKMDLGEVQRDHLHGRRCRNITVIHKLLWQVVQTKRPIRRLADRPTKTALFLIPAKLKRNVVGGG